MVKDKSFKDTAYLVDATAFCYRAFYALPALKTSYGQPTNAVYGFVNMLNRLFKEHQPKYLAVCFDVSRDTFRKKKFAAYKIQRPPMPDGLSSQISVIKDIIGAYRISCFEKEGFEAEDIIATVAEKLKKQGMSVIVVSSDKDTLQLVDEHIKVFSPYKDKGTLYSKETVFERYGVGPERITDVLALIGDDIDNIPGVPGVGEKTAVALLKNFQTLDNLLINIDKVKPEGLKEAIKDNIENINLNRELVKLDSDMAIDFELDDLRINHPDYQRLYRIFRQLEFKKLLKDLPVVEEAGVCDKDYEMASGIKEFKNSIKENTLILYCDYESGHIFLRTHENSVLKVAIGEARDILADAHIKKIVYDLKKCKLFLKGLGVLVEGIAFDVMLAAYLVNPSRPDYSLESIAWDYLDSAFKTADPLVAVGLIKRLEPLLEKELREKSLDGLLFDIEMPLTDVLVEMESAGVKIDADLLRRLSRDMGKRLETLIADIHSLAGIEFNINSPKQLGEVLFNRLKLPVIKKTKTGFSTDETVLKQLSAQHKLPALLLEYRQITKLKSTYVDTLPELINAKTKRIHANFSQIGTETGRLSCNQPNLQNIPIKTEIGKMIRKAVTVEDQNDYLVSADYSQIELRILAHLSKDDSLISAFHEDRDIHKTTASLIYGVKEQEVGDSMRETAKRINFGIIYGLSAFGLAQDLGIPQEQAQDFIDSYFVRYPKVKEYLQAQIKKAKEQGYVTTILGRRRYIPQIADKNAAIRGVGERQAINTPIQGSAADLIKQAMIEIHKAIKQNGLKSLMILQIHDELLFEVSHKELNDLIPLIKDKMENVIKLDVPIKVAIKKGKNWLEMEEIK